MNSKNVSVLPCRCSCLLTAFLVLAFALSSATAVFAQPNWGVTSQTAPEGGNWTNPDIWVKSEQGEERFPEDTYPGEISEGTQEEPFWLEIRQGIDAGPVIVDQEIEFRGRLDAPEGGTSFPNMASSSHLLITETGKLTLHFVGDTYRFGLGGGLFSLLEIDGGSLVGPTGITWIGSWSGSAEVNITNGGLIDANWAQVGIFSGVSTVNIYDGTFATNRLTTGTNAGIATFNVFEGEMHVRGPINDEPATFTLAGPSRIHLVDGILRAAVASLGGDGLSSTNIANWIASGNITGEYSTVERDMPYTGWNGIFRWNDSGDEIVVWTIGEPGSLQGPSNRFVPEGESVEFSASITLPAGSGEVSFQWQQDGVDIPGATDTTLVLSNVTGDDSGVYSLVITEDSPEVGVSTASVSAVLRVVDSDSPVLLNVDIGGGGGALMSGNAMLRLDGIVDFIYEGDQPGNQMGIGEGDAIWNGRAPAVGTTTYSNFVDTTGVPLGGLTFRVSNAAGGGDAPDGGGIDEPITDFSGPLLRDFVYTTGSDELTLRLGGLQAFAGREFTLVVYALGPQSTFDTDQTRDDIATVRLSSANNFFNFDPVVTDTAGEGRDLRWNERAFAAFQGRVSANGTIIWTVGPVAGTPGWNALNGFQILITNDGEPLDTTPLDEWRLANFGTQDNTGITGDNGDFDGDGIKNLIEYAIGADPTVPGDAASRLETRLTALDLIDAFEDDFSSQRNFITQGTDGTGWDRITGVQAGTGARIESQGDRLLMTSTTTFGDVSPLTIARSVPSGVNLQATAQLLDVPSTSDDFFERPFVGFVAPQLYIGRSDDPNGVSHYVSAHFFDAFGFGNGMQVVNNYVRTHDGSFTPPPGYPWMRIEFMADTGQVIAYRSADGEEWEQYATQTLPALTDGDAELEIGLIHVTWSDASPEVTFVEWGHFEIRDLLDDGSGEAEVLTMEFDYIGDPSLTYTIEATGNLNEGWDPLQVFGPFLEPGRVIFMDSTPIGADPLRFIRLNVRAE